LQQLVVIGASMDGDCAVGERLEPGERSGQRLGLGARRARLQKLGALALAAASLEGLADRTGE
jgi:hypothetical protein